MAPDRSVPRMVPAWLTIAAAAVLSLTSCAAPQAADTAQPAPTPADPATDPEVPRYRPSSHSEQALPITSNAYGAFRPAPNAPRIGDRAPELHVPLIDGGSFNLDQARTTGPVLVIFYRGFW